MDGKIIGSRCGMLLSELAPDVESALDAENGPRPGTNPRPEFNIYVCGHGVEACNPFGVITSFHYFYQ